METVLNNEGPQIIDFPADVWQRFDPVGRSFQNINTLQDYFSLRETSRLITKKLQGATAD